MCQREAVKFSHVIHIRSQEGCEEEEEDGEEGEGVTKTSLMLCQL